MGSLRFRVLLILVLISSLALPAGESAPLEIPGSRIMIDIPREGPWTAPLPSPDGRYLAFTRMGYRGLYLLNLETGGMETLSEAPGAGFHAAWSPDGLSIAFRTFTGGRISWQRIVVAHPGGVTETASALSRSLSLPHWRGDDLVYYRFDAEAPEPVLIGPQGRTEKFPLHHPAATPEGLLWRFRDTEGAFLPEPDQGTRAYFLPKVSPDGRRFVVECLDGHLYMGDMSGGSLTDLGPGSYPSFCLGGSLLLIERTADDGHYLTEGDLFLVAPDTLEVRAVTDTPDAVERRPAMAPDGHTVYFEDGGNLFELEIP